MKIDRQLAKVICQAEYYIGSQCYNDKYERWLDNSNYRYPVKVIVRTGDNDFEKFDKRAYVGYPDQVLTMKYEFGVNDLYIGKGLVKVLEYLEEYYDIDFNELEEQR